MERVLNEAKIGDPTWQYKPAADTDIKATWIKHGYIPPVYSNGIKAKWSQHKHSLCLNEDR